MRFAQMVTGLCLLVCAVTSPVVRADAQVNVVVSIKPLHALVLGVMQGVANPELLLDSTQSPHHASLRPSDMRLLAKADLVIWAGPQLETYLPRVLRNLDSNTTVVSLMDNPHLELLPQRGQNMHAHERAEVASERPADPHIWLNTRNADLMVDQIAQALIRLDPVHTPEYTRNTKHMHLQIEKLRKQIADKLIINKKFISYHDSYQYFEHEFNLHNAGVIAQGDELQPSAHHIRELRQLMKQQAIPCVFYEAPRQPAVINTLLSGTQARAVELDSLGLYQHQGSKAWLSLMRTLADNFSSCFAD
jgi:zinc transport system substrate-binding protein